MQKASEIILCTLGTRGDVQPFLLLARRLLDAGWPVTLLSNENWRQEAHRLGVGFHAICPADRTQSGRDDYRFFVEDVMPSWRSSFDYLRKRAKAGAAALVYRSNMLGVQCAAVTSGLPMFRVVLQPAAVKSLIAPPWPLSRAGSWLGRDAARAAAATLYWAAERFSPYRNHAQAFRRSIGLPPEVHWRDACREDGAVLMLSPAWFALPQADWPSNLYLTGFPLGPEITPEPEIMDFVDRLGPPIVFTPGTGVEDTARFFDRAAAIANATGHPALFLSHRVPDRHRGLRNVLCRKYADLGGLLHRAAAIVHHGGIGTTAEALRAGCPQIVVPDRFDQPDNAMRVARLGLGAAVMSERPDADAWAALLSKLLASTHVRLQLATARGLIAAEDGVGNAVKVVEEVLA